MATSMTTSMQQVVFSFALEDLTWTTDGQDVRVRLFYQHPGQTVIDTTLAAVNGKATLYETRELVERYMRHMAIARMYPLQIQHLQGTAWQADASITVLFCEKTLALPDGGLERFLLRHFLSTISAKVLPTDGDTVERLFFVHPNGTPPNPSMHVTFVDAQGEVSSEDVDLEASYNASLTNLFVCEFSLEALRSAIGGAGDIIAVTVSVGERHMEYYRPARKPHLAFEFLNAFNVRESAYLCASVNRKTEDGRKIARVGGKLAIYDRRTATSYEVQTAPLSFEQADWLDQLITSPDVRLLDGTPVVVTDGEAACSNNNAEMNSMKFTFTESDQRHSIAYRQEVANVFTVPPHSYQFS